MFCINDIVDKKEKLQYENTIADIEKVLQPYMNNGVAQGGTVIAIKALNAKYAKAGTQVVSVNRYDSTIVIDPRNIKQYDKLSIAVKDNVKSFDVFNNNTKAQEKTQEKIQDSDLFIPQSNASIIAQTQEYIKMNFPNFNVELISDLGVNGLVDFKNSLVQINSGTPGAITEECAHMVIEMHPNKKQFTDAAKNTKLFAQLYEDMQNDAKYWKDGKFQSELVASETAGKIMAEALYARNTNDYSKFRQWIAPNNVDGFIATVKDLLNKFLIFIRIKRNVFTVFTDMARRIENNEIIAYNDNDLDITLYQQEFQQSIAKEFIEKQILFQQENVDKAGTAIRSNFNTAIKYLKIDLEKLQTIDPLTKKENPAAIAILKAIGNKLPLNVEFLQSAQAMFDKEDVVNKAHIIGNKLITTLTGISSLAESLSLALNNTNLPVGSISIISTFVNHWKEYLEDLRRSATDSGKEFTDFIEHTANKITVLANSVASKETSMIVDKIDAEVNGVFADSIKDAWSDLFKDTKLKDIYDNANLTFKNVMFNFDRKSSAYENWNRIAKSPKTDSTRNNYRGIQEYGEITQQQGALLDFIIRNTFSKDKLKSILTGNVKFGKGSLFLPYSASKNIIVQYVQTLVSTAKLKAADLAKSIFEPLLRDINALIVKSGKTQYEIGNRITKAASVWINNKKHDNYVYQTETLEEAHTQLAVLFDNIKGTKEERVKAKKEYENFINENFIRENVPEYYLAYKSTVKNKAGELISEVADAKRKEIYERINQQALQLKTLNYNSDEFNAISRMIKLNRIELNALSSLFEDGKEKTGDDLLLAKYMIDKSSQVAIMHRREMIPNSLRQSYFRFLTFKKSDNLSNSIVEDAFTKQQYDNIENMFAYVPLDDTKNADEIQLTGEKIPYLLDDQGVVKNPISNGEMALPGDNKFKWRKGIVQLIDELETIEEDKYNKEKKQSGISKDFKRPLHFTMVKKWAADNIQVYFSDKYYTKRNDLYLTINNAVTQINTLTNSAPKKTDWNIVNGILKKYRDTNNVIDGRLLNIPERNVIREFEMDIENAKLLEPQTKQESTPELTAAFKTLKDALQEIQGLSEKQYTEYLDMAFDGIDPNFSPNTAELTNTFLNIYNTQRGTEVLTPAEVIALRDKVLKQTIKQYFDDYKKDRREQIIIEKKALQAAMVVDVNYVAKTVAEMEAEADVIVNGLQEVKYTNFLTNNIIVRKDKNSFYTEFIYPWRYTTPANMEDIGYRGSALHSRQVVKDEFKTKDTVVENGVTRTTKDHFGRYKPYMFKNGQKTQWYNQEFAQLSVTEKEIIEKLITTVRAPTSTVFDHYPTYYMIPQIERSSLAEKGIVGTIQNSFKRTELSGEKNIVEEGSSDKKWYIRIMSSLMDKFTTNDSSNNIIRDTVIIPTMRFVTPIEQKSISRDVISTEMYVLENIKTNEAFANIIPTITAIQNVTTGGIKDAVVDIGVQEIMGRTHQQEMGVAFENFAKFVKSISQWKALSFLNPKGALKNQTAGLAALYINQGITSDGKFYNAFGRFMKNMPEMSLQFLTNKPKSDTFFIYEYFMPQIGGKFKHYLSNKVQNHLNLETLKFMFQENGEYVTNGVTTELMLDRVVRIDGVDKKLRDVIKVKQVDGYNKVYIEGDVNDVILLKQRITYNEIMRKLQGNQGGQKAVTNAGSSFILNEMLSYRNFLPYAIENRFGVRKTNMAMQAETEGYFRTLFGYLHSVVKNEGAFVEQYHILTLYEKQNMIKAAREAAFIVITNALMLMLGFSWWDKDRFKKMKQYSFLHNIMIYNAIASYNEVVGLSPLRGTGLLQEGLSTIKQTTIHMQLLQSLYRTLDDLMLLFTFSDEYTKQQHNTVFHKKGDFKIVGDMLKLTGLQNASAQNPFNENKNIELQQQIKDLINQLDR